MFESQEDDMAVMIQHVSSTEGDDMVVISNYSSVAPDCQETVGRMMKGQSMVTPVVRTGAVPPTPVNYEVLLPACDVCLALDGFSRDDEDELQRQKKGARAPAMNSCNPSMNVNPPASTVESKKQGKTQRKTWGVPMV